MQALLEGTEEILPLTEAKPVEQDEEKVEAAEEATSTIEEESQEEETEDEVSADEFDDEDLDNAPAEFLVQLRFIPRKLSYGDGTNSSTTPGTCPACADAADAAIIDAEISQDEESDEPGSKEYDEKREEAVEGDNGMGDMGDGFGEDELTGGLGDEPGAGETEGTEEENANTENLPAFKAHIPGQERWKEDMEFGAGLAVEMFARLINVGSKAWRRIRDRRMRAAKNIVFIQRFWEKKLSKILNRINTNELAKQKALAFPAEDWVRIAKTLMPAIDFIVGANKYVLANDTNVQTPELKKVTTLLDQVGIKLDFENNDADMSDFNDLHARDSVVELGYTPRNIESLVNYVGKLGKLMDKDVALKLKTRNENLLKVLKESSRKEPNSEIVKAQITRMDYSFLIESVVYRATDLLISDLLHVLSNFEDAVNARRNDPALSEEAQELRRSNKILEEYSNANPHDRSHYNL